MKLVSYVYRANIVFTFTFPGKTCLLSFLLSHFYIIVPRKILFVLVFTFSFRKEICLFSVAEKICLLLFLLSRFYIIVPRKKLACYCFYLIVRGSNMFILVFIFSFLEKFILSSVTRKSRLMYSSAIGLVLFFVF